MKSVMKSMFVIAVVSAITLSAGCGKKAEEGESGQQKTAAEGEAADVHALPTDSVPFAAELEAAGFAPVFYDYFPPAVAGRNGRMILYRPASGGTGGGMVYVEAYGNRADWVWHWYFDDLSPKSVRNVEVNHDGMWDVRLTTDDGGSVDFIQDETFTLRGGRRNDRVALNGTCSQPMAGHPLWHCFDDNEMTAWISSLAGGEKPFIELASPLGLTDGILAITALEKYQPKECEVYADSKRVQKIKLEETTNEQLVKLDQTLRTAKKIRLVFKSAYGNGGEVAVAEMEIR